MEENKTDQTPDPTAETLEAESLDATQQAETVPASGADGEVIDASKPDGENAEAQEPAKKKLKKRRGPGLAGRLNIYLLLFIFVLLIAAIVTFISYQRSQQASKQSNTVSTEPLSDEDLEQLRQTDVKVGDPKQILTVESNAIFAGKVLIRDSLEVAGEIKVGGPLNLPGISVSGSSSFDQVALNNLQISGDATIQGQLNVQNNLGIAGSLTVGGTISAGRLNIEVLQINQDLVVNGHINAGGPAPSKRDESALGGGGTSSISGTDTAGTVNINTGGGTAPGCFVTLTFARPFNQTPHVVITPVGPAAASVNYYVNRSANNFSICTTNAAPVGQNFAFDYIAID